MFIWFSFALVSWCIAVACYDIFSRRVPNILLGTAVVCHLLVMTSVGYGLYGLTWERSGLGLLIGCIALLPFYFIRWMGAGDVKFFAVIGLLLGPSFLLPVWLIASLLAGLHGILILCFRGAFATQPAIGYTAIRIQQSTVYQRFASWKNGRTGIPYAAYLAIGVIVEILLT